MSPQQDDESHNHPLQSDGSSEGPVKQYEPPPDEAFEQLVLAAWRTLYGDDFDDRELVDDFASYLKLIARIGQRYMNAQSSSEVDGGDTDQ